jgi:hypothetical protein
MYHSFISESSEKLYATLRVGVNIHPGDYYSLKDIYSTILYYYIA